MCHPWGSSPRRSLAETIVPKHWSKRIQQQGWDARPALVDSEIDGRGESALARAKVRSLGAQLRGTMCCLFAGLYHELAQAGPQGGGRLAWEVVYRRRPLARESPGRP